MNDHTWIVENHVALVTNTLFFETTMLSFVWFQKRCTTVLGLQHVIVI